MQHYVIASQGGGATALVTGPRLAGPVSCPTEVAVHGHGAYATETTQREHSRLALIMVVNAAIAGLGATVVFAAAISFFLPCASVPSSSFCAFCKSRFAAS